MANQIVVLTALAPEERNALEFCGLEYLESAAEFLKTAIANPNTRTAYEKAIRCFLIYCASGQWSPEQWTPLLVRNFLEYHGTLLSVPSVKVYLSALRGWFDFMMVRGTFPFNPAQPVRGPKHSVSRGKTPFLNLDQVRSLLQELNLPTVRAARDRAILGTMIFTFARVTSVCQLKMSDYFLDGHKRMLRLETKGGKILTIPVHHVLVDWLEIYLGKFPREQHVDTYPLFSTLKVRNRSNKYGLVTRDIARIVKFWCGKAGLPTEISPHSFRASGITAYLGAGGSLENAAAIAGHASTRTTQLYDRRADAITLSEIERIRF